MPRTSGYQEKSAEAEQRGEQEAVAAAGVGRAGGAAVAGAAGPGRPCAGASSACSARRRRSRGPPLGLRRCGPGSRRGGRDPGHSDLLDGGQDAVHLGRGVGQQLADVRVRVGEHGGHRGVEHGVDLLRLGRLELQRDAGGAGHERGEVLLRDVGVLRVGREPLLLRGAGPDVRLAACRPAGCPPWPWPCRRRPGPGRGRCSERQPLQAGLDLGRAQAGLEHVAVAAAEGAGAVRDRAQAEVGVLAARTG